MEPIKITTDSLCDLSPEILAEHDITILPLTITMGDHVVSDDVDVPEQIYNYIDKTGFAPKTAACSVDEHREFFLKHLPKGGSIIHINVADGLSAMYKTAITAAKEIDNVYVVDSRNASTGIGILILRAVALRAQGLSAAAIVEELNNFREKVRTNVLFDDVTCLQQGGRFNNHAQTVVARKLHIKSQLTIQNGKIVPQQKFRGSFFNCVKRFVTAVLNTYTNPILDNCFITYTKLDDKKIIEVIREQILARYPFKNIYITTTRGVMSTQFGPNAIAVVYAEK